MKGLFDMKDKNTSNLNLKHDLLIEKWYYFWPTVIGLVLILLLAVLLFIGLICGFPESTQRVIEIINLVLALVVGVLIILSDIVNKDHDELQKLFTLFFAVCNTIFMVCFWLAYVSLDSNFRSNALVFCILYTAIWLLCTVTAVIYRCDLHKKKNVEWYARQQFYAVVFPVLTICLMLLAQVASDNPDFSSIILDVFVTFFIFDQLKDLWDHRLVSHSGRNETPCRQTNARSLRHRRVRRSPRQARH